MVRLTAHGEPHGEVHGEGGGLMVRFSLEFYPHGEVSKTSQNASTNVEKKASERKASETYGTTF